MRVGRAAHFVQSVERERHLDDVEARVVLLEIAALHAHAPAERYDTIRDGTM